MLEGGFPQRTEASNTVTADGGISESIAMPFGKGGERVTGG